jgi:hypothetical protein
VRCQRLNLFCALSRVGFAVFSLALAAAPPFLDVICDSGFSLCYRALALASNSEI